jgi:hypothetical protein
MNNKNLKILTKNKNKKDMWTVSKGRPMPAVATV